MKKYHVTGVGNALVDREYQVSDSFLERYQVEKSIMTLLDEAQQQLLLGELNKEFKIEKRVGGGSAANSLVALSQFGGQAFYCCKVANDEDGIFYRKDLQAAGVDTHLHEQDNDGHTGKCVVMVTPDAERTMCTFLGITIDFSHDELKEEAIKDSEYLYIEGYLATSEIARDAVKSARKAAESANTKIALTFSDSSMVKYFKEGLDEFLTPGVDVLFCNREEAEIYTGKDSQEEAMNELLKYAKQVVVTQGKEGALIGTQEKRVKVPGFPVKAIDTNGAGDMFAGAYLYAVTQGWGIAKAGTLASRAAAEVVTHYGPRLPAQTHEDILQELAPAQAERV
ncbi:MULTISPECIES: adenosine kinase [Gammaproteobacteria]|uniref:adenosine kinase n=1 Tax=Gammaproteobacteria TaxID=1236 RepID=UPI000DD0B29C|nr:MULTISPECIES: adenosine kinase [Gammaproteobacteria]RTE86247.1 adenosine kinase [Aliidiomarina sp. B3213]TCZ91598.1 adenosine kinase [Lysobacter sp. N42]